MSSAKKVTPWSYPQAVTLCCALVFNGLVLHAISDVVVKMPPWPVNFIIFVAIVGLAQSLCYFFSRYPFIYWLGGVPLCLVSLLGVGFLALFAATIPQTGQDFLHGIIFSWPFAFLILLLFFNLLMATLRRLNSFSLKKDLGFILNHAGLLLLLSGMIFGSGDIKKLRLYLQKNFLVRQAYPLDDLKMQNPVLLPFGVTLEDFTFQEEPKKFYRSVVKIYEEKKVPQDYLIMVNKPVTVSGWSFFQASYQPDANPQKTLSIIEIVQDPWIWLVYVGSFLMIGGSFVLLGRGATPHKEKV